MASHEQQWAINSNRSKQQIRQTKRKERAQRMHMQAQQKECAGSSQGSLDVSNHSNTNHHGFPSKNSAFSNSVTLGSHDEDSEASHNEEDHKPLKQAKISTNPAPISKLSDPLYDEDIIDGFAILSFSTYEELEAVARITDKTSRLPDPHAPVESPNEKSRGTRNKKSTKSRTNGSVRGRCTLDAGSSGSTNGPAIHETVNVKVEAAIDSGSRDSRATSIDRFSDVSRHSNSSRGYLCDSESEENDKHHPELRGHSPHSGGSHRSTEFVAPNKQRSFSPAHAATPAGNTAVTPTPLSSSATTTADGGSSNVRWVGLSGSPRPATAVAPHGYLQNGPRLPDCQPTEGGAGPSPAPPAAPSPRLPLHPPVAGSPLNTFPSPSANSTPVIRSGFNAMPPSSSPASSQMPVVSYAPSGGHYFGAPSSMPGPRPPSPVRTVPADLRTSTTPTSQAQKLPTPTPPVSSPFQVRPGFPTPVSSFSLGPPPPLALTSSATTPSTPGHPFFPPSMMRTPMPTMNVGPPATTSMYHTSFLTPSSPVVTAASPGAQRIGPYGTPYHPEHLAFSRGAPFSVASFVPAVSTIATSTSKTPETSSSSSRPGSRASISLERPGSLPLPGFPSSSSGPTVTSNSITRRSPGLPPPMGASTFLSPVSAWPRQPQPDPRSQSPNTASKRASPLVRSSSSAGRSSPAREALPLLTTSKAPTTPVAPMGSDAYADMIRRELDSRFLSSGGSGALGPMLPPPHGLGKLPGDSPLYRPLLPPPSMPPPGLPGLSPAHFPPLSMAGTPTSLASSMSGPPGQAPGLLNNLGLPPSSANPPLALKSQKPGKWNAMHVRIAWEIYHTQQRLSKETGEQKKTLNLNLNLTPKLNLGINPPSSAANTTPVQPSASAAPPPSTASTPSASVAKIGFDAMPSSLNPHNPPFGFSHQPAGFLPRLSSVPTPPPGLSLQPLGPIRHSPAPDQWNRLPATSNAMTAPWLAPLAPLMTAGSMTALKDPAPSSGIMSSTGHHPSTPSSQSSMEKERERQKREERDREREKEKQRERERSERQERERKREEERERERRRHASRSPLHHHSRAHSSASNSGSSSSKTSDPSKSVASSMAGLPSLSTSYPAGMMSTAAMFAERSRLGLGPLPPNPYGQFDPFREGLLRGMDPRESEFLSRFGPNALGIPGGHPGLYGSGASPYGPLPGLVDRYRDSLGRDGFPGMPGAHLNHPMSASLGLHLPGQPSLPGMSGPSLYPPVSSSYPFPGLGPLPGLAAGMSSLPLLPPSMMPGGANGNGKRTPTGAPTPVPSTSLAGPSALASLQRTNMGLMAPGLGLPPYPMPSPSPYPHLIPPPMGSRPPSSQLSGPALGQFNPLDPYAVPKSDPQAR